jgi:uncharacterized glyoxalase superfamily protein PhnB
MNPNKLPDNLSMPACTIIPVLEYTDIVAAIIWLTNTFGFSERWRAGNHRAQLSFEDGAIAISQSSPDKPINRSTILVRIRNVPRY